MRLLETTYNRVKNTEENVMSHNEDTCTFTPTQITDSDVHHGLSLGFDSTKICENSNQITKHVDLKGYIIK